MLQEKIFRWRWEIVLTACVAVSVTMLVVSEIGHARVRANYSAALESMRVDTQLGRLIRKLADAETGQRGFLLTRREQYLVPYTAALPEIQSIVDQLTRYYARGNDADRQARMSTVAELVGQRLGEMEITVKLAAAGKWEPAIRIVATDIGKQRMDDVRDVIDELQRAEQVNISESVENLRGSLQLSRLSIAAVTALNILLLVILVRWLKQDARRSVERETALERLVRDRTDQLRQLASHLQDVAETEKTRLGRELHDELGAILTATKMDLAWVQGKLAPGQSTLGDKLGRAMKNLDQGIQTKRRIIEGLRPTTLASFGLMTAARDLIEQTAEQAGWKVELDLPDTDPDLSEEAEIAMFRILQEALNNAAKYAHATRVQIKLTYAPGIHCWLEIQDNGVGFHQRDVRPKATGLLGMRQRLVARRGKLDIESRPGQGTLIRAVLPLAEDAADVEAYGIANAGGSSDNPDR